MAATHSIECASCNKQLTSETSKPRRYCSIDCYRSAQRSGAYKRGHGPDFHRAPCAQCGTLVERNPSQKRNGERSDAVYCNRACYDAARTEIRKSREASCACCGSAFVQDRGSQFCSDACRRAAKKASPKNCINCDCWFTPVKKHTNGKIISHNSGKTCSLACQIAWISNNEDRKAKIGAAFKGAFHPNWQGGKSQLNNTSNRGPNWAQQRRAALKRDRYACVDCSMTEEQCQQVFGRSLDVDHVVPFHNFRSYRQANALSNLECRCASCHRIAEAKRDMVQMVLPMQDSAKRSHKGRCRGERINTAKLTEYDVRRIRRRFAEGESRQRVHADYPQVGIASIHNIATNKTWRHIA